VHSVTCVPSVGLYNVHITIVLLAYYQLLYQDIPVDGKAELCD